ncbi:toxin-antitoxin system HicB family antitoxin [Rhodococcus zopfii]|uniref:Toxin-antitoxin system HicB family antitoxin n=1 Tax=Rhodococcus zopfii TaxID=43772 RepID=A0ABU3WTE8_9NOCA|nr:toxin-antitoxin system HicB family antitoxin [Rhodococcus zopfii]MDV2477360.1 toxin-antitoxin system HicB family antitoxin [Rhodococcus zopfii]
MPVRLHPALKEAVAEAAKAHGMDVNSYVSALLAANTGLTHLVPPIQQEALPNTA